MGKPFVPSAAYFTVLTLLQGLTTEELYQLKIQGIHREQMDRQGRVPHPDDAAAKVGTHALEAVSN